MKAKILQTTYQLEIMNKPTVLVGKINVNKVQWKQAIDFLEGKTSSVNDDVLEIITELMTPQGEFNHEDFIEVKPKAVPVLLTTIEEAENFNRINNITSRTAEETLIIQAKNNEKRYTFRFHVDGTQDGWRVTRVVWGEQIENTKLSWKVACMVEQGITRSEFNELKQALFCKQ